MKILCVFGKYQYGDVSRGINTEYAAFIPALQRLGHSVVHFESFDYKCYSSFIDLNKKLLEVVEQEKPNVLLTVQRNFEIWLETLEIIKSRGDVATVSWTTDDSWKYRETSRFIGKAYHAMTTTYPKMLDSYRRDGINNVLLTQWAANAGTLCAPIPAESCRYQVTFIGQAHGDRVQSVSKLHSLGLNVVCFGHGWPSGAVEAEQIPEIMRNSVISLNFANSKTENQIKARNFEVPGAGGFLLTEYAQDIEKYYVPDKEIVVFNSLEELVEKANYYLAHTDERDRIAYSGYERTVNEHTYDKRMKDVLEFAIAARCKYSGSESRQTGYLFDEVSKKHSIPFFLSLMKSILLLGCTAVWGKTRGPRAARRILFELSWRLLGAHTYTSSGWPGRLFYKES